MAAKKKVEATEEVVETKTTKKKVEVVDAEQLFECEVADEFKGYTFIVMTGYTIPIKNNKILVSGKTKEHLTKGGFIK